MNNCNWAWLMNIWLVLFMTMFMRGCENQDIKKELKQISHEIRILQIEQKG